MGFWTCSTDARSSPPPYYPPRISTCSKSILLTGPMATSALLLSISSATALVWLKAFHHQDGPKLCLQPQQHLDVLFRRRAPRARKQWSGCNNRSWRATSRHSFTPLIAEQNPSLRRRFGSTIFYHGMETNSLDPRSPKFRRQGPFRLRPSKVSGHLKKPATRQPRKTSPRQ